MGCTTLSVIFLVVKIATVSQEKDVIIIITTKTNNKLIMVKHICVCIKVVKRCHRVWKMQLSKVRVHVCRLVCVCVCLCSDEWRPSFQGNCDAVVVVCRDFFHGYTF